jgi:acetoin utilization deacetylase AcuC-like enzyme
MKVIFHDDFYQVYTDDPAAGAGRMESVVSGIAELAEWVEAEPAPAAAIAAVHTAEHIERIRRLGLYDIAALAAGGAIRAAEIGMEDPCFAAIRPPGHHASAGSCWGFCFFNNMAVAIESLKRAGRMRTAYILDFDLHFGDGTENILGKRSYVTIHNPGSYDRESYLEEVEQELRRYPADVIGISAGFDNHRQDWGGLLTTDDYATMGRMVRFAARRNGGGCFALLEGGYNHDVLGRNACALMQGLSA